MVATQSIARSLDIGLFFEQMSELRDQFAIGAECGRCERASGRHASSSRLTHTPIDCSPSFARSLKVAGDARQEHGRLKMAEAGDRSRAAFSTIGDLVSDVRRIVVLRANGIGDFVVTLPALEAVRAAYREPRSPRGLDWHAAFLAGRELPVDRVVAIPEQAVQRQPEEWGPDVAQSIELLASEGWDSPSSFTVAVASLTA